MLRVHYFYTVRVLEIYVHSLKAPRSAKIRKKGHIEMSNKRNIITGLAKRVLSSKKNQTQCNLQNHVIHVRIVVFQVTMKRQLQIQLSN